MGPPERRALPCSFDTVRRISLHNKPAAPRITGTRVLSSIVFSCDGQDPLVASFIFRFVDVDTLLSWGDSYKDELNSSDSSAETFPGDTIRSPFLYNRDINGKVVLWKGDVALLNCTAIVNTSNESLTDKNPVSESIFMLAGPDLKEDLQKLKGCRTGEAKLTKGFNLAARFIIHTVGPKYKSRYRTAAESSLYSCYRNVLQLA
ncbi:hypothetical protein STEG23_006893, partial [Scotinomys teguina]